MCVSQEVYKSGLVLKLAKAPLNLIRSGLQTVPGLKTLFPKGPNIRTPSPGGGKGPGIFGAAWTTVEAFMNTKNGEYVDAVMAIAGTFGPFRLVKGLMAAGFLADTIAEVFGNPEERRTQKTRIRCFCK